ncbi:MAG: hypothetical protein HZB25_08885 [Candidatus Eisenbacteria bacterium]|nr:hypothetical protein [Candidatus Eisenbacteria bacterium]
MDFQAAARAGAECDEHVRALRAAGAPAPEPRRWAEAATRMLALCHRAVVTEQDRVARELESLEMQERCASRYAGKDPVRRRSA